MRIPNLPAGQVDALRDELAGAVVTGAAPAQSIPDDAPTAAPEPS